MTGVQTCALPISYTHIAFSVLREWEKRHDAQKKLPDFLVCEFSSWLVRDTIMAMHGELPPMEVCALTNFYPDHLNSYESIENYFDSIDLLKHLSPTRGNGIRSMVQRIQATAQAAQAA